MGHVVDSAHTRGYLAAMPAYTPVTDNEIEDTLEVLEFVARESIKADRARKVVERMRQELTELRAPAPHP